MRAQGTFATGNHAAHPGEPLEIDKDTIINFLKSKGRDDDAARAEKELPDKVDHEQHADLLSRFGVNPSELLDKLPGGVGSKLGGLLGGDK